MTHLLNLKFMIWKTASNFIMMIFFEVDKSYDAYLGEYEVVPAIKQQQLDTKDKLMKKDVVISAIPFFETSNDEGGNTVYIGKEL